MKKATRGSVNAHLIYGPRKNTKSKFPQILHCREIGHGKPSVITYTNFINLGCLVLHAKLQGHQTSGSQENMIFKVYTIYVHYGQLGHVAWTIYIK